MTSQTQVAIITGGASGIGLAVAQALALRGAWQIVVFDRDTARASAAVQSVPGANFHGADIADYTSLTSAFKAAYEQFNGLDFVFANAGIAMTAPVSTSTEGPPTAPDTSMIDVNLNGAINTTLYYLAQSGKGGNLILTASSAGFYASVRSPAYSASKHGVIGWTRSLAPTAMR